MKIIKWIIIAPFILLALFYLARFIFCRPDANVKQIASPLAKVIVEHIEKNGVAKSLNDISGLPYTLECGKEKVIEHNETDYQTKQTYISYIETTQSCSFINDKKYYSVYIRVGKTPNRKNEEVYLDITHKKTLVRYQISYKKGIWLYAIYPKGYIRFGYGKRTGICKNHLFRIQ